MFVDTTQRSNAPEMMDNFQMEGEILKDALDKIASINQLLGGNKITIAGVDALLHKQPVDQPVRIIDIGCGNGDMLRVLADHAKKRGLNFILHGVDANQFTISHAQGLSSAYENISYSCADIFDKQSQINGDIILCTLTLHHFTEDEIIKLLERFTSSARLGFVINDLQRSALAYHLFQVICLVFRLNYMSREDGLVSILRGFKRADLLSYAKKLNLKNSLIKWKWAFRYQWIVKL